MGNLILSRGSEDSWQVWAWKRPASKKSDFVRRTATNAVVVGCRVINFKAATSEGAQQAL